MLTARVALALTLALAALPATAAMPIALSFHDETIRLNAPPVLRAGRILVPARATFTALGAAVFYDPHARLLAVRRGGRTAIVTRTTIIANRSYVPLREIARALDMDVVFHPKTRVVEVFERDRMQITEDFAQGHPKHVDGPTVESRHPLPEEQIVSGFPVVYATIQTHGGPAVDRESVHMNVDGLDVTSRAQYVGDAITYTPSLPFAIGPHSVAISGRDLGGLTFAQSWTFFSRYNPSQEPSTTVTAVFVPPGLFAYNDRIVISALGPPGGTGFVTIAGLGTFALVPQYSQPGYYIVTIFVPANIYLPQAYVSGYILSGGRRYALNTRERLSIDSTNVPTAAPRASAAPTPQVPTPQVRTPMPPPVGPVPR